MSGPAQCDAIITGAFWRILRNGGVKRELSGHLNQDIDVALRVADYMQSFPVWTEDQQGRQQLRKIQDALVCIDETLRQHAINGLCGEKYANKKQELERSFVKFLREVLK